MYLGRPPPLTPMGLDRRATASQRPASAASGIAGSSGAEMAPRWSATRAERGTILDLGIPHSPGATRAGRIHLLAQIAEGSPSHLREFALAAPLSAAVRRLGLGQRTSLLQQHPDIERRGRVPTFVGTAERRLGLGQRATVRQQHAE